MTIRETTSSSSIPWGTVSFLPHRFNLRRRWSAFAVLILTFTPVGARAEQWQKLNPQGYVNDFAGVLNGATVSEITRLSTEVDQKAKAQIAVVTVKTLDGDPVEDFANRLFQKWGVGYKGTDRGVMVLMATQDHKYWTEVGYGLEPVLPDGKVGGFGRDMLPYLRRGDYNSALLQMAQQIAGVIAQDSHVSLNALSNAGTPAASSREPRSRNRGDPTPFFVFLLLMIGVPYLITKTFMRSSTRGWGRSGGWRGGYWGGGYWGGGGFGGGGFGGGGGGFGGFGGGASGGGGAGGGW